MMYPTRPAVYSIALAATVAMVAGCSDDTNGAFGCPEGQTLNARGVCVPVGQDTGRGRTDAGTGDAGDTTPDTTPDVTLPETCTPFERTCVSPFVAAECSDTGEGWTQSDCPAGTTCEDGACILAGEACTPGQILGCESPTQQRVCQDDGTGTEARLCPAEAPNCVDGACSDQLCAPNARRCDGNDVLQCDAAGQSEEVVQVCEFGCSAGRCADPCAGDGKDYLGCVFWAADLDNYSEGGTGGGANAQFAITVSNGTSAPVPVRVEDGTGTMLWEQEVAPGQLETVNLGPQNVDDTALTSNTFRVTSDAPITVHQFNPIANEGVFSNDASLLLPATSIGSEYVVNGWPTSAASSELKAFVAIIAVGEEQTNVTVTSPIATSSGGGVSALSPGVAQEFTMEQGQILSFTTSDTAAVGFTGMEITSSQPIAVFSGSECANIPVDNKFCDHIEQQLFPVDTWGREFIGAKFRPRGNEPDVWRVVAAEAGTVVQTNPSIPIVNGRTLGRGEYVEFVTDQDFVLTASRPVSLAQFMVGSAYPGPDNGCDPSSPFADDSGCAIAWDSCGGTAIGDPAFLINVPTVQFRNDYLVLTPAQYQEDYFTIIARPGTTITIDGTALTTSGAVVAGWEVIRVPAADGVHEISASQPVGLYAYGYDCDVSYAYPGGLNLDSL